MHHHVDVAGQERFALRVRLELVPFLRIGEKHLDEIDAERLRGTERVAAVADVCSDAHGVHHRVVFRVSPDSDGRRTLEHWLA
ncbi:60S ribosomal protein L10-1 [Rhodococcus sp. AW25M09]|nr:60S ribosomal protein L10-1 [Rhodococcus sp. AW25M09]